jgi:hypothetical protein
MRGLQHANAFVIQFRDAGQDDLGRLSGRVEHVASGRTSTFQAVDELPQLLLRMLRSMASDEADGVNYKT